MLTPPVGVTFASYWNAIKAGNLQHIRMTFTGQNIVLEDEDISLEGGMSDNDILNGETDLVMGKAVCEQINVAILNTSKLDSLVWEGEFTLEMGVEISGVTKWVQIGVFAGEKPNNINTKNVIQFTAYDRMKKFDVLADKFYAGLTYPITVSGIYTALCTYIGISKVAGNELANIMNRSYSEAPVDMVGYTCRDILAWIAEACGCYARINADGNVQMIWFNDQTSTVSITADEEFHIESADASDGLTWDEADQLTWDQIGTMSWDDVCGYEEQFSIDQLQLKMLGSDLTINYPSDLGGNVYMIVENPFLSVSTGSDIMNYIKPIYDRLVAFGGYLPVQVNCIGNWLIEAGDIITVHVFDKTIAVPIFLKSMGWNGTADDTYEATGNKSRPAYSSEKSKEQVINQKSIKLYVEDNYYQIKSGIEIEAAGVTIQGSKYIKLNSGSTLDAESGSSINVKSGADINIKAGSSIDIESGGNLNIVSGGNIDIHGTGTLELTGSTVKIKSGSTFDVDSTNFKISSSDKEMVCGSWKFNNSGVYYGSEMPFRIGSDFSRSSNEFGVFYLNNSLVNSSHVEIVSTVNSNDTYYSADFDFGVIRSVGKTVAQFSFVNVDYSTIFSNSPIYANIDYLWKVKQIASPDNSNSGIEFVIYDSEPDYSITSQKTVQLTYNRTTGIVLLNKKSTSGDFNIECTTATANQFITSSSRDVKHNINDMPSKGDQLDMLRPVTFVYDDDRNEKIRAGLIYEDAIKVMPEICFGDERNKAINYMDLIPMLLKEIQELRKRVKDLEEKETI